MHVAIVTHNYPTEFDHSYGFFCKQQAEALTVVGHRVSVIGAIPISLGKILAKKSWSIGFRRNFENGVETYLFLFPSIPKFPRLSNWLTNSIGKWLALRYQRKFSKPDIIHLQVYVEGYAAISLKNAWSVPLIWTEHFSNIGLNQIRKFEAPLLEKLCIASDERIAVSDSLSKQLNKSLGHSFSTLHNTYNSKVFKLINQPSKQSTKFIFINVAYLLKNKNHVRLIKAFAQRFKGNKSVSLRIIGGGSHASLLTLAKQLFVDEQVSFLGDLTSDKVAEQLRLSNAFVLSSDYETFGVSLIEAMACGLPVISTKCGGPEAIIRNEKYGILTDLTESALGEGMLHVFNNYYNFSAEEIAKFAHENFSLESIGKKLTAVYVKTKSRFESKVSEE